MPNHLVLLTAAAIAEIRIPPALVRAGASFGGSAMAEGFIHGDGTRNYAMAAAPVRLP